MPSPDGGKVLLVRHRVLPIPTCGGAPGAYFGISTVHFLSSQGASMLFPTASTMERVPKKLPLARRDQSGLADRPQ